jgi:hypothetical protein
MPNICNSHTSNDENCNDNILRVLGVIATNAYYSRSKIDSQYTLRSLIRLHRMFGTPHNICEKNGKDVQDEHTKHQKHANKEE